MIHGFHSIYVTPQFKMGKINKQTKRGIASKCYRNLHLLKYCCHPFPDSFLCSHTSILNISQIIYLYSNSCLRLCFWETQSRTVTWLVSYRSEIWKVDPYDPKFLIHHAASDTQSGTVYHTIINLGRIN